jgi:hypothetical protein
VYTCSFQMKCYWACLHTIRSRFFRNPLTLPRGGQKKAAVPICARELMRFMPIRRDTFSGVLGDSRWSRNLVARTAQFTLLPVHRCFSSHRLVLYLISLLRNLMPTDALTDCEPVECYRPDVRTFKTGLIHETEFTALTRFTNVDFSVLLV